MTVGCAKDPSPPSELARAPGERIPDKYPAAWLGTTPPDLATVVAVRPGQTYSRTDSGAPGAGADLTTTVTNRTVYVDVQ